MQRGRWWAVILLLSGCGGRTGTDEFDFESPDAEAPPSNGGTDSLGDGGSGGIRPGTGGRGSAGRGGPEPGGPGGRGGSSGPPPVCTGGTRCSGVCVDPLIDVANCGGCGIVCPPGSTCRDGSCTSSSCGVGQTDCGGLWGCVDLRSNPITCGSCSRGCNGAEACVDGQCSCPQDGVRVFCNGTCVHLLEDDANCGRCNNFCTEGTYCVDGGCVPLDCEPPRTFCPNIGQCVDLGQNALACGDCFTACAGAGTFGACRGGVCVSM